MADPIRAAAERLVAFLDDCAADGFSVIPEYAAELRTALAAAPPAPDPHEALAARPLLEQVARMGDRIGQHTVGEIAVISDRAAAWLAENPPGQPVAIEPRGCPAPGACSCLEPPAPAPVEEDDGDDVISRWIDSRPGWPNDWPAVTQCQLTALIGEALEHWGRPATPPAPAGNHIPDATEMVADGARLRQCPTHGQQPANAWGCPECLRELREELTRLKTPVADGEREELAQWLEGLGDDYDDLYRPTSDLVVPRLARAAALLREPAPAPVPVSDRPWERDGWCDAEGRCWWLVPNQSWLCVYLMKVDSVLAVTDAEAPLPEDAHCLPHWAIPQPPQGEEVAE